MGEGGGVGTAPFCLCLCRGTLMGVGMLEMFKSPMASAVGKMFCADLDALKHSTPHK